MSVNGHGPESANGHTPQEPVSAATTAAWRRWREASATDLTGANGSEKPRNGFRVPAYAPAVQPREADSDFAESQQAGLAAMLSIAKSGAPPRPRPEMPVAEALEAPSMRQVPEARETTPVQHANGSAVSIETSVAAALVIDPGAAPPPGDVTAGGRELAAGRPGGESLASMRTLPLIIILTVQAYLSLRLITRNSAFTDEALYLWAGRLEWSHWLHHTPVPPLVSYFSGAPVVYPPIAALASGLGGLAGARILSLCFVLGATVLLHGVTRRILDRQSAAFAAALFAGLGSAEFLGAFATYDAMALLLLATATWLGIRGAACRTVTGRLTLILLLAVALVIANTAKYASALFDPVVLIAVACFHWRELGRRAGMAAGSLATVGTATGIAIAIAAGGKPYLTGIAVTTLSRTPGNWPIFGILFVSAGWVGAIAVLAVIGAIAASCAHRSAPYRALVWTLAAAAFLAPAEQARIHVFTSLFKHVAFGGWFAAAMAGYALTAFIRAVPAVKARGALTVVHAAVALAAVLGSMLAINQFGTWQNVDPALPALTAALRAHPGSLLTDQTAPLNYYLESLEPWQSVATIRDSTISQDVRQQRFTYILLSFAGGGGGCGNADPAVKKTQSQCLHYIDLRALYSIISDGGYRLIARIPYRTTSFKSDYMLWMREGVPPR